MPVIEEMPNLKAPRFGGYCLFDIETGPLPDEELNKVKPAFEAPANYKDPEKIKTYIQEAEVKWKEQAALSAVTGRVLCIGTKTGSSLFILENDDEGVMLEDFWSAWIDHRKAMFYVGFCCKRFDLPFLVRRSWALGVRVPADVRNMRYWSDRVVDLSEIWSLGNYQDTISLKNVSRFLGIGDKTLEGGEFYRLWQSNREQALAYVANDLMLTEKLAVKLGVMPEAA